MATNYIFLGPLSEVGLDGTLSPTQGDRWSVRPLLGIVVNSPSGSDTFTPALLIRKENPGLRTLLALLGATVDAAVDSAAGEGWQVLRFDGYGMQTQTDAVKLPAVPPESTKPFLPYKEVEPVKLTAIERGFGPGKLIDLSEPSQLDIKTPAGGMGAEFTLAFNLNTVNLASNSIKIGNQIDITYNTTSKQIAIGGRPLNFVGDGPVWWLNKNLSIPLEGQGADLIASLDVTIPNGSYTHKPLIPAIAGSQVRVDWESFVIRLRQDRIGLAAPPGDPDTELATATFSMPLIMAKVGPEEANALAKLVPVEADGENLLLPLNFKVLLRRPEGWAVIGSVLWSFEGASGQILQDEVNKLRALFQSDEGSASTLSNLFAPLEELGEAIGSAVSFGLDKLDGTLEGSTDLLEALKKLDAINTKDFPLPVAIRLSDKPNTAKVFFFLGIARLNLWEGRLADNRIFFYLAQSKDSTVLGPGVLDKQFFLDLTAFAVEFPARSAADVKRLIEDRGSGNEDPIRPGRDSHDGYLDLVASDVVLDLKVALEEKAPIRVLFPGDLKGNPNLDRRVMLLLEDFDPATWPEKEALNPLRVRLGTRGLTFKAKAETTRAALIPVPRVDGPELSLKLLEKRDGLSSGLVVIDNKIRYADLGGRLAVPGFDNLEAEVRLGLRRDQPDRPPVVTAVIDLDRSDRQPLARIRAPYLKAQLDDLRMQLTWSGENSKEWDLRAWASGAISLVNEVQSTGGVSQLDQPRAIPFQDLDLTQLHKGSGTIRLGRSADPNTSGPTPSRVDETARFELLDRQFRVEFTQAELTWNLQTRVVGLLAERAQFAYLASSGEFDVAIDAGGVELKIKDDSLHFRLPGYLAIQVRIGEQIAFAGGVGWVDTPSERCFVAQGQLRMTGFPEVAGNIKLGTGVKSDGSVAPNIALFGELPFEADLFAGVVMKRLGLGLGLNNQLAALGPVPDSRTILANIDRIDPKEVRNWSFVTTKGVYVSVVATATLTANRGPSNIASAYVAKLVLSIDTNLDIVAAGRIWLFSSEDFVARPDNATRPTVVAAADFKPRAGSLQLVAETGTRPAIEANPMLADLFSRARARFSFYLSPDLADYYLEELSYRDSIFGISVLAAGSYRIAIGRFGALITAQLALRGDLPERTLRAGPGGFSFSGALRLDAGYGGVVSRDGFAAYGFISARLMFNVSAFILIPVVEFQLRYYEKVISISFSIPYLSCKRWRCKWKTREIREETVVRIPYIVPVVRTEECHIRASLDLLLEGDVAFDETGGFGFSGTIAISVVICCMSLNIAPRFDFRPEMVSAVRRRVAAVEDRINQLRGIPRQKPPAQLLAVADENPLPQETWYHYTSQRGDQVLHLLVPSPDQPTWWYTPHASDVGSYANLPRDTALKKDGDSGVASDRERVHLSPFRSAVMRMVLPFEKEDGSPSRVIDLAMPWDRANYDALPDEDAGLSDDDRIALVMMLTQIEASFLDTAAIADNPKESIKENDQWADQENDPNRIPITGIEVVSDPRPETNNRRFWTLTDQMTLPEGVLPFRYRPVAELVAEGFAGLEERGARRDDIGRLLRYEQVRARAARQNRHDDPRPARRLAQARASLLSSILADFARDDGPQTYGPIESIKLVREEQDQNGQKIDVLARRYATLKVLPEGQPEQETYTAKITLAILENSTALDLQPLSEDNKVKLQITWDPWGNNPKKDEVILTVPGPEDSEDRVLELRHKPRATFPFRLVDDFRPETNGIALLPPKSPLKVRVERVEENSAAAPGSPRVAMMVFEAVPPGFATPGITTIRQVGLFAVTNANERLLLNDVRIIRNEPETLTEESEPADWAQERPIRVISLAEGENPVQAIQRRVTLLRPTQEFQEAGDGIGARVVVKLPVRFEESLLRADLPRLNGFEIYRQLPGEPQPVKIVDGVPPQLRFVDEADGKVMLVEAFLYGEELLFERSNTLGGGRFTGPASGVVPDLTPIRYFLRAVPYGRSMADAPLKPWPSFTLHIPPPLRPLPPLGLVIAVEALLEPIKDGQHWKLPVHLVDHTPATYEWPEGGWDALEIWAEPVRIRSSGAYAVTEETPVANPGSAQRQAIRKPDDITSERVPRAVTGMVKLGVIKRPTRPTDPPPTLENLGAGEILSPGCSYRLFVRPELAVEKPLVEPLNLYIVRQLPERVDPNTPTLPVERLELISPKEVQRILDPTADPAAWIPVTTERLTRDKGTKIDTFERFRFTWQHPGEEDAGVEILTQDRDEPHQVGRMLVTVQEEAVFQMALRDFRTPALWRPHPAPIEIDNPPWPSIEKIATDTPSASGGLTAQILWRGERNPVIERVRLARNTLKYSLNPFITNVPTEDPDWVPLFIALFEYMAALRFYQRTPLAPGSRRDRLGLEVLLYAARATLLGLKAELSPAPDSEDKLLEEWLSAALTSFETKEEVLKTQVAELAAIDLSSKTVADTPEDYKRVKAELQDIDLARRLAAIIRLRLELADDLLDPNLDDEDLAQAGRQQERLPGFLRWEALVDTYRSLTKDEGTESLLPRTKNLLGLFGEGSTDDNSAADGHLGALVIKELIGRDDGSTEAGVRDPSILLDPDFANDQATKYLKEVQKLVPQAAGLTASVDALRRDAQAQGWTLLRRPHHQLGTEVDETKGRIAVVTPLRELLPYTQRQPDPTDGSGGVTAAEPNDDALAIHFANLLERLGLAVDLAVINELNQPVPQRQLRQWIQRQAWDAVRASIGPEAGFHDVIVVTGREPDTERDNPVTKVGDEDQSLGYAFLKLVVAPRSLMAAFFGRSVDIEITGIEELPATPPETIKFLKVTFAPNAKGLLETAGLKNKITLFYKGNALCPPFDYVQISGDQVSISLDETPPIIPTSFPVTVQASSDVSDLEEVKGWLVERSISGSEDELALLLLRRMAREWWNQCTNLYPGFHKVGHIIMETRGRRWATVPALGTWAHIDWEAPDAAGREILVAARRVSRYEALLRWARGRAVPVIPRLPRWEAKFKNVIQALEWRRRIVGSPEEPETLPVLVSPHPTRIDFILALPASGARATVSGLSRRRNGYRDLTSQFFHRNITPRSPLVLEELLGQIRGSQHLFRLDVSAYVGFEWTVEAPELKSAFNALVVLVNTGSKVRALVSKTFIPSGNPEKGQLTLFNPNSDEPIPDPTAAKVMAFRVRDVDPTPTHDSTAGTLALIEGNWFRIRSLHPNSECVERDSRAYVGQVVLIYDISNNPIYAGTVLEFHSETQTLLLDEKVPNLSPNENRPFRLFLGSPVVRRVPLSTVKAIADQNNKDTFASMPTLYRHEWLLSLRSLPFYREYTVAVRPRYEVSPLKPNNTATGPDQLGPYARRGTALLATYPAALSATMTDNNNKKTYAFRITVPRQGDFLTPSEKLRADPLDRDDLVSFIPGENGLSTNKLAAAELPDLACLFQILWRLGDKSLGTEDSEPAFVQLADVVLPGHSIWTPPRPPYDLATNTYPIQVVNRSSLSAVLLIEGNGVGDNTSQHIPLRVWHPTADARPVYELSFKVEVRTNDPTGELFEDSQGAFIQAFRAGRPSRAIPIREEDL